MKTLIKIILVRQCNEYAQPMNILKRIKVSIHILLMLSMLGKNSADDFGSYLSYVSQETGFDILCKLHLIRVSIVCK